ncbi:hypothetical protein Agub_g14942 [Astrephomene gubernaculifera]|uniref:Nucleotide-diphospho-sugar transferase domain-containing protein n=1 Tax=Astrephomene gubernaculifera TaxID=47775 RepID=A0AAD3E694_9CHLO|nr:hypothetical protein Agub_g14942 [Astrephomene gubernaculifera]
MFLCTLKCMDMACQTYPVLGIPVLLILACLGAVRALQVTCRSADYCSTGLLAGYVGPLDTAEQAKTAFDRTHYRRELIMFAETRLVNAALVADRCIQAGYGHVLPLLVDPGDCQRIIELFKHYHETFQGPDGVRHNVSCGWYRTTNENGVPYKSGFKYLKHEVGVTAWWRKWFTVARAVMLGYNVMAIDEDVVVLGDWYGMVKSPPLSQYTMFSQAECAFCINGGFSYIQNAAPNGPAAYLVFEAMQRAVRWAENGSALFSVSSSLGMNEGRYYQEDQSSLTDSLLSCMAGRPLYYILLRGIGADEAGWAKLGGRKAFMDAVNELALIKFYRKELLLEGPMAAKVWGDAYPVSSDPPREANGRLKVTIMTADLHMPHSGGEWPMHMGGYLYGTPGPYTLSYRKAFQDLGVPLPPDPEDPATAAQARAIKPELFALIGLVDSRLSPDGRQAILGSWLEHNWFYHGRVGHWHLHLQPKYTQAIGHIHSGLHQAENDRSQAKRMIMQHSGHYNWQLAGLVHGGPARVFYATEGDEMARFSLQRVVAYAPGVLHYGLSKETFIAAVSQLARVAVALRAVAAWPAVDCSSDWVLVNGSRGGPKPVRHTIPWLHLDTFYTVSPFGRSLNELKCEWSGFHNLGCLRNDGGMARGLLAVEFEHLLHSRRAEQPEMPHLVLQLQDSTNASSTPPPGATSAGSTSSSSPPSSSQATFQRVTYRQLLSYNADSLLAVRHWGQPLWLDRLVEVVELPQEHEALWQGWRKRCPPLRYYELEPRQREKW